MTEAANHNAYMRQYMKNRYDARRRQALEALGGKCADCGSTENLEFDHIDPSTKLTVIAKMWTASEKKFWGEIRKCQLLCVGCHRDKTLAELGRQNARKTHGTLSSHRYCRCASCRQVHNEYVARWKQCSRWTRMLEI